MKQTINAIYEKGVFLENLAISEGKQVRLTMETSSDTTDLLELAAQVYQGLSEEEIDEIEQIALNRSDGEKKLSNYCTTY